MEERLQVHNSHNLVGGDGSRRGVIDGRLMPQKALATKAFSSCEDQTV